MLDPLDRAELRKIAIVGMGLEPLDAYTMKETEVVSWIHERAEEFSKISLASVGEDTFRPGVSSYISQLQEFVTGNRPAPKFPPEGGDADVAESANETVDVVPDPPKRKRGRPRKVEAAQPEAEAAPKRKRGRPRKKIEPATSKGAAEVKKATAVVASSIEDFDRGVDFASAAFLDKIAEQGNNIKMLQEMVSALQSDLNTIRIEQTESMNMVSNTLAFLVNTLAIDEDEQMVADLSKIPTPDKYVVNDDG
tara:strand:- start:9991 stop:10743 length:753 start_codon:yes stop_codon:yes gene_type:complete